MSSAKGVDAVERALSILDLFANGQSELSLADIAKGTGYYKSTILRLIVSLERFGYLVRTETGRYRLGSSLWRLGSCYRESFSLAEIIEPELKILSDTTHETASYFIREGDSRICMFRKEPDRAIRHALAVGANVPLNRGASGKILMAYSEPYADEGTAIREAGFASSAGERDPEVAAVSVPVLTPNGKLLGALAISGLITRFNPDRFAELASLLKQSRNRLSRQITY